MEKQNFEATSGTIMTEKDRNEWEYKTPVRYYAVQEGTDYQGFYFCIYVCIVRKEDHNRAAGAA